MYVLAFILAALAVAYSIKKALYRLAVLAWHNKFQKMEFDALRTKEYAERWQPVACLNYSAFQSAKAHFAKFGNVHLPLFVGSPTDSYTHLLEWERQTNENAPNYIVLRFGLTEWQKIKNQKSK